jgi:hypothetical protein
MPLEPEYWPEWDDEPEPEPEPLIEIPPDCCKPQIMAKARHQLIQSIIETRDGPEREVLTEELQQLARLEARYAPFWEAKAERVKAQERELRYTAKEPAEKPTLEIATEPQLKLLRKKS